MKFEKVNVKKGFFILLVSAYSCTNNSNSQREKLEILKINEVENEPKQDFIESRSDTEILPHVITWKRLSPLQFAGVPLPLKVLQQRRLYGGASKNSRVGKGISAQAPHRTVLETLTSHGSSHSVIEKSNTLLN